MAASEGSQHWQMVPSGDSYKRTLRDQVRPASLENAPYRRLPLPSRSSSQAAARWPSASAAMACRPSRAAWAVSLIAAGGDQVRPPIGGSPHHQVAGFARDGADHDGVAADGHARTAMPSEQHLRQLRHLGGRGEIAHRYPASGPARWFRPIRRPAPRSRPRPPVAVAGSAPWEIPPANGVRPGLPASTCPTFYPIGEPTSRIRCRRWVGSGTLCPA